MDCNAVEFHCADLCASDSLSDSYLDLILSIDVIEHVTDAVRYVKGMRQRLKPGGLIWLFTPHRYAIANIVAGSLLSARGLDIAPQCLGSMVCGSSPAAHPQVRSGKAIHGTLARRIGGRVRDDHCISINA